MTEATKEYDYDRSKFIATDEDFEVFINACLDESSDYVEVFHKDTLYVWKKASKESNINIVRLKTEFPDIEPEVLYDVLHDHYFRQVWDANMIEGSIVEQVDGFNEVGYYAAKMPIIANRDYCNHRAWRVFEDRNIWAIFNRSVLHPECPEVKGFVRGWSFLSGYLLRRREGGGTSFYYYTHNDPKGWLPTMAVNYVFTKLAPNVVNTVAENAAKYPEWKAENRPDWKPWLTGFDPKEPPYKKHQVKK